MIEGTVKAGSGGSRRCDVQIAGGLKVSTLSHFSLYSYWRKLSPPNMMLHYSPNAGMDYDVHLVKSWRLSITFRSRHRVDLIATVDTNFVRLNTEIHGKHGDLNTSCRRVV